MNLFPPEYQLPELRPGAVFSVIALILVIICAPARAADPDSARSLVWPVKSGTAISSNFCEYREGHLHAGLDIRTSGADGVPCVASGDGYVSRLRASSEGYGKALYMQLDSGETLVYAHLAEFRPDLEDALLEEQQARGRFKVSARYPRGRFPVSRGEVIAWSGSTGGVAPHLHFEVRDKGENPLNPYLHGFEPVDRLAPVIGRIQFVPRHAGSSINGACWPVEPRVRRIGEGRYILEDTLHFAGETGVAVEVFDYLNSSSGKLAPHRIQLLVDDSTIADIRLERFSFSHAGDVNFLYDMSRVRREKAYFFQLFESQGESLWNRQFVDGGSLGRTAVRASTGRRFIEGVLFGASIIALDYAGNQARLDFRFYINGPADAVPPTDATCTPFAGSETSCLFIRDDFVSGRRPLSEILVRPALDEAGKGSVARVSSFYKQPVAARCGETGTDALIYLFGVRAGVASTVDLPATNLRLEYSRESAYTDMVQYVSPWNGTSSDGELELESSPIQIGPYGTVLAADMKIRFNGAPDSSYAVYRLNEKKLEWVYYTSETDESSVSTTAKRPGVYGVFSDRVAPRVHEPVVGTWKSYATGRTRPEIAIGIEDNGSGVDFEKTTVLLDGDEQIFYWDNRRKKLFVVVRGDNIIGQREIQITAFDKIGNQSVRKSTIVIPTHRQPQGKNR